MVTKEKVIFRFDRNISYITINKLISFLKDCTKKNIEEVKLSFSKGNSAVLPSVATILGGLLCHYKEKRGFKFSFENTPQYLLKETIHLAILTKPTASFKNTVLRKHSLLSIPSTTSLVRPSHFQR